MTAERDAVVGWSAPGKAAWRHEPEPGFGVYRSNPLRQGDLVVALLHHVREPRSRIVALDAKDGRLRWFHDLDGRLDVMPRAELGSVLVSANGDGVRRLRLDAETGRVRARVHVRQRSPDAA